MKKIILLLVFLILTGFFYFDRGVVFGQSFTAVEERVSELKKENKGIELQIAEYSSFNRILTEVESSSDFDETSVDRYAYSR